MTSELLLPVILLIIFTINAILLTALAILKVVHRRRTLAHNIRRKQYLGLLSRHLAYTHYTEPITEAMAEDPAFLDALIDMRNAISGDEVATLGRIVNRHGVIERQMRFLDSSLLLGRRLRAAVALAELGDETSAETLMEHLDDREPEIRIQCARGLGRIRWTPAIDEIVSRFSGEIPWVRTRFSDTLVGYGTKATWPLLAYVRINHRFDSEGPALALRTIAQIQDDQAVTPLLEILARSPQFEVKLATIEALGDIGSPEALPDLEPLLDASEWEVRAKTAGALGGLGDPSAIPRLIESMRDANWWVRRSAAAAVAQLPGGIATLHHTLDDQDPFAADAAAEALIDAGELVSARRRFDAQGSSDEPLLAHMGEVEAS
ncbi:MAG TPA: HEAT repeat domain-containing protein [Acidimicrobiia bacterium]|nr:HEAT repeat domain-containing protein [Acidimicrobiia bacterium]